MTAHSRKLEELIKEYGFPEPELCMVLFSEVSYDPRVQRPEDPRKLAELTANWEPAGRGVISLSRRSDGTLICLDGQHRTKAAVANAFLAETPANVWEHLSLAQEALLFRLLNNTTKVGVMASFVVALTEEDPHALAIKAILDKHGVNIGGTEGFNAIAAAQRITTSDKGVAAFEWAITVVLDTWGASKKNLDGRVVEALAMIYKHYGPIVDTENLRQKLTAVAGGVYGLLGKARTVRDLKGGRIQVAMIEVIVSLYNSGKRKNILPEWVR